MYNYEAIFFILISLIMVLILLRTKGYVEQFREPKVFTINVKKAKDRSLGLMHIKKKLNENHGLLFDYGKYVLQGFWMKNTYIPLDIIYLDHQYKIIGFSKNMIPKSEETVIIDKPFRYAIEVNAETVKQNKLKINDYVKLLYTEKIIN